MTVAALALIGVLVLSKDDGPAKQATTLVSSEQDAGSAPAAPAPAPPNTHAAPSSGTNSGTVTKPQASKVAPAPENIAPAPQAGPTPGTMYDEGMYAEIMSRTSLNIRTGPSTGYGKVIALKHGTAVTINCWTRGDMITPGGGRTPTDVWDHVIYPVDGWVADAYVNTGSASPAFSLPSC